MSCLSNRLFPYIQWHYCKSFPKGARIFKIVSSCGLVIPLSILTMIGCFTPLNSSSFFWLIPHSCRAFTISPINATLRSLSAISSGVKSSCSSSFQLLPIVLLSILAAPFYQIPPHFFAFRISLSGIFCVFFIKWCTKTNFVQWYLLSLMLYSKVIKRSSAFKLSQKTGKL